ncbi:MAG: peptidyl-prolyl cis-trans isomerase [Nitrospirota bacterium]
MGKDFHNNKISVTSNELRVTRGFKGLRSSVFNLSSLVVLSVVILIIVSSSYASYREFDLLDEGYEYYLSYQPVKAVETFNMFLKEFPDSSAKDAAMFWLGKSLIQIRSLREAKKVFSEIKREFPDSPFKQYVDTELELISKLETQPEVIADKPEVISKAKLKEVDEKMKAMFVDENELRDFYEKNKACLFLQPEEMAVESLIVRYSKADENEKAILAVEIQREATEGKSFEEIGKSYIDTITFTRVSINELPLWIKEKVNLLKSGDVSDVIWTEQGFMILKPVMKGTSYRPFEEVRSEIKERLLTDKKNLFLKGWIKGLISSEE